MFTDAPNVLLLRRPGPVFTGDIPFTRLQCIRILSKTYHAIPERPDWKVLSKRLITNSQVYHGEIRSYDVKTGTKTVSELSILAIVGACCLAGITFVGCGMVMFSLGRSTIPHINCLDGVSSMLGQRYGQTAPKYAVVGLCSDGDKKNRVKVIGNEDPHFEDCE